MTSVQVATLCLDVAEIFDWTPETIKHMTIAELIFWRTRDGTLTREQEEARAWRRMGRGAWGD